MGLNPFRDHDTSAFDIALVVVFAVITAGVVAWALLG
jgi:hypothetical protein